MRLQLIIIGLLFYTVAYGVGPDSTAVPQPKEGKTRQSIDMNILFSYYDQDGNNSAVTGGRGTEKLTDYSSTITFYVPLDTVTSVTAAASLNYYTSASSDNIDTRKSSPSRNDTRSSIDMGYNKEQPQKRTNYSLYAGGSIETDYLSSYVGSGFGKMSKNKNRSIDLTLKTYFDTWQMIFPDELRTTGQNSLGTNKRRTFLLSSVYEQTLTKNLQLAVMLDLVGQQGLLSTPFHRVFFNENDLTPPDEVRVERLPQYRIKIPLGFRLNYYPLDRLVLRGYYRFYVDTWGVISSTISIEAPIKLTPQLSIYPFYRFYTQTAANYFAPYAAHDPTDEFYTSDFDLSGFNSHKVGGGIKYSPLWKLGKRYGMLKSIAIRYAHYRRTNGLVANMVTGSITFRM